MDGQSLNLTEERIHQLRQIFPDVFSEGKIDFNRLRAALGENVLFPGEHYELSWAGKADARREVQRQTTATLIPDVEGSVDFDNAQNVFIEGENLEVLRVLQKSYFGKVKMIYIDPPYNTGNDSFVYPDDFAERQEDYLKRTGAKDEAGFLNKQDLWKKNSKENGQFHSVWLSMMYPRLYLARNLMREDGVIFVSIDDNEVANLRLLMDEVFGEENFIAQIIIQSNKRGQTYKEISKTHEYLLLYSKGDEYTLFELEKMENSLPYEDAKGKFDLWELRNRNPKFGRHNRPNLYYPIYVAPETFDTKGYSKISLTQTSEYCEETFPLNSEGKESCWRWGKDKVLKSDLTSENPDLVAKKTREGKWNIYEKARKATTKAKSLWDETGVISEQGTMELGQFGLADFFDHPKPKGLISKCVKIATEEHDLILDFFAGSATTAQAVLELNAEDGGNRRFILVQMPEPLEENSEAWKAGYRSIADIGRARVRKVIERLQGQAAEKAKTPEIFEASEKAARQVLGFQSYRLQYSNFKVWRNDLEGKDAILNQLQIFQEPLSEYRGKHSALLTELVLKAGFPLTVDVTETAVDGCPVFDVDGGRMWVALERVTPAVFQTAAEARPTVFVTLSGLFAGGNADETMSNANLQLKDAGVDFKVI